MCGVGAPVDGRGMGYDEVTPVLSNVCQSWWETFNRDQYYQVDVDVRVRMCINVY